MQQNDHSDEELDQLKNDRNFAYNELEYFEDIVLSSDIKKSAKNFQLKDNSELFKNTIIFLGFLMQRELKIRLDILS